LIDEKRMDMQTEYGNGGLTREEVDALESALVLEFGAGWCGYCQAAQPLIEEAFAGCIEPVTHLKIEDGKGRRLGRSFKVKLWPTLVFIKDHVEVARVVRPGSVDALKVALTQLHNDQVL